MHQQFYYQLRRGDKPAGVSHALIALDHNLPQEWPLPAEVPVGTQAELDSWVRSHIETTSLEPTTRAHLMLGHGDAASHPYATDAAQWLLYAEAFLRQSRHRNLIGDRPEVMEPWAKWLREQPFDVTALPKHIQDYFAEVTTGREMLARLHESPSLEWNTALMVCMNPSCKVDPTGKSHESGALQPRVMANKGRYGWTLSFSVAHLDYSQVYTPPKQYDDEEDGADAVLDLGLDGKEATATIVKSMAQKDEHGAWKDRPETKVENASFWFDGLLLSLRHNKDVKREVLQGIVETAVAAGIPQTQIIKSELPKTQFLGSGLSKALLEVVIGQPWERIGQQIQILEGLGYKEELPLYLWLQFKSAPQESYELPTLS